MHWLYRSYLVSKSPFFHTTYPVVPVRFGQNPGVDHVGEKAYDFFANGTFIAE